MGFEAIEVQMRSQFEFYILAQGEKSERVDTNKYKPIRPARSPTGSPGWSIFPYNKYS